MGKQTVLAKKRRGPGPTGKGEQIVVRMQPISLAALDAWVAKQTVNRHELRLSAGWSRSRSRRRNNPVWATRVTAVAMEMTALEIEFLQRLMKEPWQSPPLFDHSLVARLVEVGYVHSEALATTGAMYYEITEAGKDAIS